MGPVIRKLITEAKRRKRRLSAGSYRRLLSYDGDAERPAAIPRGYLPVLVVGGGEEEAEERFLVHIKMLKKPCMAALLQKAAEEFGYGQAGILRIPCGVEHFRRAVEN
ncbi:hypothetical protein KSP40_PGU011393 [Platanthera guangdongensis]|uniref:Small auxin up regulated protein n=1 Tax=Platanthera guangdongensis TaxID=2320717 RepID=A0ABR2MCF1_9ASPA